MKVEDLTSAFVDALRKEPCFFAELVREHLQEDYRSLLQAWSEVRMHYQLDRDAEGRYLVKE